jgi:hypothetical protein
VAVSATLPPPLLAAIDALYEAFAGVPRPLVVPNCSGGCSGCLSREETDSLDAPVPLRELPEPAVGSYALYAMTTLTDVGVLRYLLPRIVELSLYGKVLNRDVEEQFAMFPGADWLTWPAAEVDAVRQLLRAWWARTLADPYARDDRAGGEPFRPEDGDPHAPPVWHVDTVLTAIARAESDLLPYLSVWRAAIGSQPATGHLRALLEYVVQVTTWPSTGATRFRWGPGKGDDRLHVWLTDPATSAAVTAAFDAAGSEETLADLVLIDEALRLS